MGKNYDVSLAVTGATAPTNTKEFKINIVSEGKTYASGAYPNQPNLAFKFHWDGKDKNQKITWGPQVFSILKRQVYVTPTLAEVDVESQVTLGGFNAKNIGLGGWVPSNYFYYSAGAKQLFSGDGSVRNIEATLLEGTKNGESYRISNPEATEIYYFNSQGKHLFTKTGVTGKTIFKFNHDSAGRLVSIEEPFGRITTFVRTSGKLTSIVAPRGVTTATVTTSLNAASLIMKVTLDANGNIASIRNNAAAKSYEMTYSALGLLLSFKKPGGQISKFAYDAQGDLIKDSHGSGFFFDLVKTINSPAKSTITSTTSGGLKTSYTLMKNEDGSASRIVVAPSGLKTTTTNSISGNQKYITTTEGKTTSTVVLTPTNRFDGSTNMSENIRSDVADYVNYRGEQVVLSDWSDPFTYESFQRFETTFGKQVTTEYDKVTKTFKHTTGNGIISQTKIDDYERPISLKLGSLTPTTFAYTNEFLTSVAQGTRKTSFGYNEFGFLQSVTNPLGQATKYQYDSLGRVASVIYPDARSVSYNYDVNGNKTAILVPKKLTHAFTFDAEELTSSYTPPVLASVNPGGTFYQYDLNRKLVKVTRPGNDVIQFTRDAKGLLTGISTPSGSYIFKMNPFELPISIKNPEGFTTSYTYNDRQIASEKTVNSKAQIISEYQVTWNYNYGLLESEYLMGAAGSASNARYYYDGDRVLTKAGEEDFTYNANTQLVKTVLSYNGIEIVDIFGYNTFGELTSYQVKRGKTVLYNLALVRDALGRITQKKQTMNNATGTWDYGYDSSGRLVSSAKNGVAYSKYTYDANGNRIGGNVGTQTTKATYDNQDRLLTYNSYSYAYKNSGELSQRKNNVSGVINSYKYDSFGNLLNYSTGATVTAAYAHDGRNRIIGGSDRKWVYKDQYRMAGEIDSKGELSKHFIYGSKYNIPDYVIVGFERYKIISDHLGSLRMVIRLSDGAVDDRYSSAGRRN